MAACSARVVRVSEPGTLQSSILAQCFLVSRNSETVTLPQQQQHEEKRAKRPKELRGVNVSDHSDSARRHPLLRSTLLRKVPRNFTDAEVKILISKNHLS